MTVEWESPARTEKDASSGREMRAKSEGTMWSIFSPLPAQHATHPLALPLASQSPRRPPPSAPASFPLSLKLISPLLSYCSSPKVTFTQPHTSSKVSIPLLSHSLQGIAGRQAGRQRGTDELRKRQSSWASAWSKGQGQGCPRWESSRHHGAGACAACSGRRGAPLDLMLPPQPRSRSARTRPRLLAAKDTASSNMQAC